MTREQAIEKARKLRTLTVQRGCTPAEAETAKGLAAKLIARFDLRHGELADEPLLPPAPAPPAWVFYGPGGQTANPVTHIFVFTS